MKLLLPFLALCAALTFTGYTMGHKHGLDQSGGLLKLAAANNRLAESYDKLAAQMARINP